MNISKFEYIVFQHVIAPTHQNNYQGEVENH